MLDIGCCAKFGGGGGFAVGISRSAGVRSGHTTWSLHSEAIEVSGNNIPVMLRLNRKNEVNSLLCVVTGVFFNTGLPSRLLAIESSSDFRCSGVRVGRSAVKTSVNFKRTVDPA